MKRLGGRDNSEKDIVATLRQFGFSVLHMHTPVDLLCGYRGKTYLVECKSGSKGYAKRLNDNQQDFSDGWRGSPVVPLHSREDAISWAQSVCAGRECVSLGEAVFGVISRLAAERGR